MPSINFKTEFAEPVKNGTKRQTIRQLRKNPIKPGDMLTMFTGQRTTNCRKLCMHKCKSVEEIEMTRELTYDYPESTNATGHIWDVKIDGRGITGAEVRHIAMKDGFKDNKSFFDFFQSHYGDNFKGVLIKW